jgi:hypothetical protein
MWLWVKGPPWRPQPHEINQTQLFGQLFHQEALQMAQMWWKSPFTIRPALKPMEILLMVHLTRSPHHKCQHMFHTCPTSWKDFIWTQLGLGYTMNQIYDKHKEIWWARANASEYMIWDDFLKLQNIFYLD